MPAERLARDADNLTTSVRCGSLLRLNRLCKRPSCCRNAMGPFEALYGAIAYVRSICSQVFSSAGSLVAEPSGCSRTTFGPAAGIETEGGRLVFSNDLWIAQQELETRFLCGVQERILVPDLMLYAVHRRPRRGVVANPCVAKVRDKQIQSKHCHASRDNNPVVSEAFTVAPEIMYALAAPTDEALKLRRRGSRNGRPKSEVDSSTSASGRSQTTAKAAPRRWCRHLNRCSPWRP